MQFDRGKGTIAAIFCLAIGMAVASVTYHYFAGNAVLAHWGGVDGSRIQRASRVDLWRLGPSNPPSSNPQYSETISEGQPAQSEGQTASSRHPFPPSWNLEVRSTKDVSKAPGLRNARHALTQDLSYAWAQPPLSPLQVGSAWDYALCFSDAGKETTVLFKIEEGWVWEMNCDTVLQLTPEKRSGFANYLSKI